MHIKCLIRNNIITGLATFPISSGEFITKNIFKNFSDYFKCDSIRGIILFKMSGSQCSGIRGKVGNSVISMHVYLYKCEHKCTKLF